MPKKGNTQGQGADDRPAPPRRAELLEHPSFHGDTSRPRPVNAAEEELVRSLGQELGYALAVVALNPHARFPEKSVAAGVQRAFERLGPQRKEGAVERARELLARSPAERQPLLGSFAAPGSRNLLHRPAITPERRELLRSAVRARLQGQRDRVESYLELAIRRGIPLLSCQSTLEGVFSVEQGEFFTSLTINEPQSIKLRWFTDCEAAEIGAWEVRRLPSNTRVASGVVEGQNEFDIDFGAFLPAQPSVPRVYEVRITPRTKPQFAQVPGVTPGSTQVSKVPSKAVGATSNPVQIAYAEAKAPPTQFFEETIYRRLELHLDVIRLVEAQGGFGADELWLYGGVLESHGAEEIVAHELPKFYKELDGDGAWTFLDHVEGFHLENPTSARWPKIYTVILAVLEEDGGEDVAEMMASMWGAVSDFLLDAIWEEIQDWLEELGVDGISAGAISATLSSIAAALAGSVVGAIVGLVLAFGWGLLQWINQVVADDFYEIETRTFVLPVSTEEYVSSLGGSYQADGSVRLATQYPRFHYWTLPGVGAYDGLVEVEMHWELTERTNLNV